MSLLCLIEPDEAAKFLPLAELQGLVLLGFPKGFRVQGFIGDFLPASPKHGLVRALRSITESAPKSPEPVYYIIPKHFQCCAYLYIISSDAVLHAECTLHVLPYTISCAILYVPGRSSDPATVTTFQLIALTPKESKNLSSTVFGPHDFLCRYSGTYAATLWAHEPVGQKISCHHFLPLLSTNLKSWTRFTSVHPK